MGNFSFNKRSNYKGSPRSSMHRAVCSKCGKDCEVPFKPTGDKPVYCSDCFEGKSGMDSRRGSGRNFKRGGFSDKKMYKAVCSKCGKDCEVPFKPTGNKPVYCSDCFEKDDGGSRKNSDRGSNQTDKQLEMLNNKLDKILELLVPHISEEKSKESAKGGSHTKSRHNASSGKKVIKKATDAKAKKVVKKVAKKPTKKKATAKKKK